MPNWTIAVRPHEALPGATRMRITGDPGLTVTVWRKDPDGLAVSVRNLMVLDASGYGAFVDAECPFGVPVVYSVEADGKERVNSSVVQLNNPIGPAPVLLRAVLRPDVMWQWTALVDEAGISHKTRATTYSIIGQASPQYVGDIRQLPNSTLIFLCDGMAETNRMIEMFKDGIPILMRTPCHHKVRDRVFAPLDIKESRYSDRYRLLEVETQTLAWPQGETDLPIAGVWTYGEVDTNVTTDGTTTSRRCGWTTSTSSNHPSSLESAMIPVSPAFLTAVRQSHRRELRVTALPSGTVLPVDDGSVKFGLGKGGAAAVNTRSGDIVGARVRVGADRGGLAAGAVRAAGPHRDRRGGLRRRGVGQPGRDAGPHRRRGPARAARSRCH